MMKKKEVPVELVDLTELTDEEIRYIGECFAKELKKVLDYYKPYFLQHDFYQKLYAILNSVKARLEKEGS